MGAAKHHLLLLEPYLSHRVFRSVDELVDFTPLLVRHENAADGPDPFFESLIVEFQRLVV